MVSIQREVHPDILFGLMEGNIEFTFLIMSRGVLVDPTPFTTLHLKKQGVPDNLIDYIIISHCHADHDAGVF